MKRLLKIWLGLALFIPHFQAFGQISIWSEDFEGGWGFTVDTNFLDLGAVGSSGQNFWTVNQEYAGGNIGLFNVASTPAQPPAISTANGNYLHITSRAGFNSAPQVVNAHWDSTLAGTEGYLTRVRTSVNTVGKLGVTLSFWFLNGSNNSSFSVYVQDGTSGPWVQLSQANFDVTLGTKNNWTKATYTGTALNGLNDIVLGFLFTGIPQGAPGGRQPSLAVDDIDISEPEDIQAIVLTPNPLPDSICVGDAITFTAGNPTGTIVQYVWNFNGANAGPQSVSGQTANFLAQANGTFTFSLFVRDAQNNSDQFDFTVYIDPCIEPVIDYTANPSTVCRGKTVQFTDQTIPGSSPILSRTWNFQGGTPLTSTLTNPVVTYNTLGSFSVTLQLTDRNGSYSRFDTNFISVIECPLPQVDFSANLTKICKGECIIFSDSTLDTLAGQTTYEWQFPGSNTPIVNKKEPGDICYDVPGVYDVTLTVTNPNGSDVLTKPEYITVDSCEPPEARYNVQSDKICENTCVQFFNTSRRADSLFWIFFGADSDYDPLDQEPIVCYTEPGDYTVLLFVENPYGEDQINGTISVAEYPRVQAPKDTTVLIGKSVQLASFGTAPDFQWTPNYALSCEFCRVTEVNPLVNTTYYITNTNDHGCQSTDSVVVVVVENYYAGVPNAFSPNGDGENDELLIYGNSITAIEFMIYDRNGNLLFETRELGQGWNGEYQGSIVPNGTYVYLAKITYRTGYQELLKGDVTVLR
jgi:gliding motility-associated-like protein